MECEISLNLSTDIKPNIKYQFTIFGPDFSNEEWLEEYPIDRRKRNQQKDREILRSQKPARWKDRGRTLLSPVKDSRKMSILLENEIVARSPGVIMRLNLQWWQGSQRQPRDQTCSYWSSSHRQPLGWVNIRQSKCTIIAVTTIITLPLNYIWSKYIQILRDFLKPLETSQYCVGLAFTT